MSIACLNRVWKLSQHEGTKLVVLLSLADRADDDGFCWPGVQDIANRARRKPRQVFNIIKALRESGEVYIHSGGGRHISNRYIVTAGLELEDIADAMIRRLDYSSDEASAQASEVIQLRENYAISYSVKKYSVIEENPAISGQNPAIQRQNPAISGIETLQHVAPEPSLEPSENRHEPGRTGENGGDGVNPLEHMLEFAKKQGEPEAGKRPRGWRAASEDEYRVCKRVSELFCNDYLPGQGKRIETQITGAHELLSMNDGDLRRTLFYVDKYHQAWEQAPGHKQLTISGPQSLVNILPNFIAQQRRARAPTPPPDPQLEAIRRMQAQG